jgi:hypothetical protein
MQPTTHPREIESMADELQFPDTPEGDPPGGLSWAEFKAMSASAGQWLWGTVQGAFNEKASFSQIVVDAVIGMIPLVGDATAVRDIIAVVIGLADDPKKREQVWEWVLLVILLFALIPVFGGVVKGVGRIVVKIAKEAELLAGAARAAHMAEGAKEIIAFLNRIGVKNAEKWLIELRVLEYQGKLVERFEALMRTMSDALGAIQNKMGRLMPASLSQRIEGLKRGLQQLREKGSEMIPKALKEFDQKLREIQAYVRSGGETTSRVAQHEVAAGRAITRAEEARLVEDGAMPARSARGWKKNNAEAADPMIYQDVYKHDPGYPDLTRTVDNGHYTQIEAFSGKIVNRELKPGEQIYRLFGPAGDTLRVPVGKSYPGGAWWGLGSPPKTAKEWREQAAVLDEWNRDGFMIVATVPQGRPIKAAVGTISEQRGTKISGQFLPGGGMQAVFDMSKEAKANLSRVAEEVMQTGKPRYWVWDQNWIDPLTGARTHTHMKFEIRPTGWGDANGVHGYLRVPGGVGTVQTARLGAREQATKENREVEVK